MAIERIDHELCNGCGICVNGCMVDVIRLDEEKKKAVIMYPDDCVSCGLCEVECPQAAIHISLVRYEPLVVPWG